MRKTALCALLVNCCGVKAGAYEYNSSGRRDPFVPLAGVSWQESASGIRGILGIDDVRLQGVVVGPDGCPRAIINNEVVKEGEKIGRLFVEKIEGDSVSLEIDGQWHVVKLYDD